MNKKYIINEGDKFERLTVIEELKSKNNSRMIKCVCDCGNIKDFNLSNLIKGSSKSCGCLKKDKLKIELILGKKYGRLTVLGEVFDINNQRKITCLCECGNIKNISFSNLRSGKTKSCGCITKTHSMTKSKAYNSWRGMKERCDKSSNKKYKNYGGRGIIYDPKWKTFAGFWKDMKEGYSINLTLDRIDSNGNYCKENCRWANWEMQSNNKITSKKITIHGETKTIAQWSKIYKISRYTIYGRINSLKWSEIEAVITPSKNQKLVLE